LANLDDLNDVAVAGVAAARALTLTGASSGINLRFADATQTSTIVTLANSGSADVANVFLTTADEASVHAAIDLTGFETLNIASADTDTNTVAASNAITALTAGDAKTVVVTGNAGLALAAGFTGTKVTSFDASAVTAGAVTYTTGALAAAATIAGGAGADTLSGAAAAIAGVTINAGAGNDAITGSATKASTLNGDAGNDTITGGAAADVIDGGAGTNTYVFSSANVVDQAGFSTTTGAVINLSSAALTQSGVFTATGAYLTTTAPTVAAGTSTYLFNGESSTNASVVDTLANIQNVTGTNLADYIVGSDAANVIIGGDGIDVMTGGAGADTFAVQIAEADLDVVTDFSSADFLSIDVGTPAANTYFEGAIAGVAITDEIVVLTSVGYANVAAAYVDGTFAAASEVTIIFFDTDTNTAKVAYDVNGETAGDAVELVNLTGITSLALLISAFATGSVIYS
jgi:Ca2+-binding RTX toxin-like protein